MQWYWQKISFAQANPQKLTGAQVWELLFEAEEIAVLLESPTQSLSKLARFSIAVGSPRQIWTPKGNVLPCLQNLLESATQVQVPYPELPFTGGWVGWLGYDLAWEIEHLPQLKSDSLPFPVAFWYEPKEFAVIDHLTSQVYLAASDRPQLELMTEKVESLKSQIFLEPNQFSFTATNLSFLPDRETYQNMVREAKQHILAGDIYQANLSLRFMLDISSKTASNQNTGWQLYRHLQEINPSPFASYWRTNWGEVISASPERLISLSGDRLETRPIAGTRPRGKTPELDLAFERELIASAKECAEHIMLLDLERNDLGKVCEWGSVNVDELLAIERYSHVMHLVSNVVGKLRRELNGIDSIRATFPGGTITGCPKVRCMEIIEQLEPTRRSLFYGSCGYLDWRGNLDLNILIRTLLKCGDRIYGQVGAGIVADSDPAQEWQESWQKAKAQLSALGISEL
jgi:para-aminobenzoate synthetase component I